MSYNLFNQMCQKNTSYNPFQITQDDLFYHWSVIYPSNNEQNITSQTDYLTSLGNFFSILYYPQVLYPPESLITEMKGCVISLSGYRDRDVSDREIEDPNIYHITDEKGERYGRRELKQAIRLTGACYSGPLLRLLFFYIYF